MGVPWLEPERCQRAAFRLSHELCSELICVSDLTFKALINEKLGRGQVVVRLLTAAFAVAGSGACR